MIGKVVTVISTIALGACSVFGVRDGTEEPPYTVAQRIGDLELRDYGPRIAAETTIEGSERVALSTGFNRLAGYIFGDNRASTKIAMTAPVAQTPDKGASEKIAMTAPVVQSKDAEGRYVIQFFMPSKSTIKSLPQPNDAQVRLVTVPQQRFAVLRFTGFAGPESIAQHRASLLAQTQTASLMLLAEPVTWFYDPPWTLPFLRRNEVAVLVAAPPG